MVGVSQVRDRLPHLKAIIQYSPEPVDPQQRDEGVMSWAEFLEIGSDVPDYEVQWRVEQQKPGHCASLIYTSGTTGQPKVCQSCSSPEPRAPSNMTPRLKGVRNPRVIV